MSSKLYGVIVALFILVLFSWWDAANIRKLSDDGWVLYYLYTCGHCITQKKQIGRMKLMWMNKVDASTNPELVKSKGIKAYPTWLNEKTNQIHVGSISLAPDMDDSKLVAALNAAPTRE